LDVICAGLKLFNCGVDELETEAKEGVVVPVPEHTDKV
jgi:hypothetical protein